MARIYVSSTYNDLKDYREQVRLALRKMEHEDVAMEYYVAEDQRPVEKCLQDVESCDLYLGIFALRYGYIPPSYDKSVTELEYRKAKECGKKCIIFLLKDGATWPTNQIEYEAYARIKALHDELSREHLLSFFSNKDDIQARVTEAIHKWERQEGLKAPAEFTNWEAYKLAVYEEHRWVRLSVIGAKQDRIAHIPLTEIFVPQMAQLGRPIYEIPDEILQFRRDLFSHERMTDVDEIGSKPEVELVPPPETDILPQDASDEIEHLASDVSEPVLHAISREQTQVILGGPGSGKSTLIHYALLVLCGSAESDMVLPHYLQHRPIPFLIELRQYVLKEMPNFVDYIIENSKSRYGVTLERQSIEALLDEDRKALIVFDGLDEVFNPTERSEVLQLFKAFAREYPKAQIIVTSRIVGYDDKELGVANFTHYTLLDFSIQQIRQFVHKWYEYYTLEGDERDAEGLIQRIIESPRLMELAGNPLLLTMMAVIYKHQDLPEQRWMLYQRCTEVLLEDWDIKRKSIDHRMLLPLDVNIRGPQKAEILQHVSMYMLEQGQKGRELNAIAYQPLVSVLAKYLEQKYSKSPGDAEVIAEEILNHLRERTYILAEVGERIFGFVHRTFMEYFAASYHKAEFNAKKADYKWLLSETFGAHWRQDEWQEVLLLLISMLSSQGSPISEIIEHLRSCCREWPPFNLAFAARCLAEAGVGDNDALAHLLTTELAREISNNAPQIRRSEVATFINEGLVALSMLGTTLNAPSQEAKNIINQLDKSTVLQDRMVAWQMGFVLRSREERLDFALSALHDGEEAVRRGAIAALEREWPGRPEVGRALLEVIKNDRIARVRQAAIKALQNAWPEMPEILDAIEARVDDESAYTYVIWLSKYLTASWKGNDKALELLLRLSSTKLRAPAEYDYRSVSRTIAREISNGWREVPNTLSLLKECAEINDYHMKDTAMEAIVNGWHSEAETFPQFYDWASEATSSEVRWLAIRAISKTWKAHPNTLPLLYQKALHDTDANVRGNSIRVIAEGWRTEANTLTFLQQRAVDDVSTAVRVTSIHTIAKYWHDHSETLPLLCVRAEEESSPHARTVILMILTGISAGSYYYYDYEPVSYANNYVDPYESTFLYFSPAASSQYYKFPVYNGENFRPAHYATITQGWPTEPTVLNLLHKLARHESNHATRKIALQLLLKCNADYHGNQPLLREIVINDPQMGNRIYALQQLINSWKDNPDTRILLYNLAAKNSEMPLRWSAFKAVIDNWRDHPETLDLLDILSTDQDATFNNRVQKYLEKEQSQDTLEF